ncbi:chain length determinant protein EpsF [Rhodoferax fermentans]|uniref:Chain length determinant protein EpsF n=1 Tax=Rhodoferax fermentans TaxID=28066 RepID=A0A1T1AUF4_RHOFE|nr:chain length determinant protein EpsF [Rhodoferax fermentans]MBK1682887.1 chain length determinant protein EpsF [Rhodoferax fermentans]OOV07739.1 chain length determinant protein EpsF [Rhodoferax fermentans]
MTLQQFLLILRARYKAALLVFLITVATTVVVSLLLPKQYTASATVVVDVKSPDPVTGQMLQGMMAPGYMATQIDIINSDRVAKDVIKLLKLDSNAVVQQQWRDDTDGKGQLIDWLATLLQKKLEVKPSRESNVINVNFSGTDPDFAAAVANAFAQAYINVNLDLRLAPARQYATFFEEQTKAARTKLEAAQKALSDYQQQNGITSVDERVDFETAKLNETSSQLTGVQALTTDSQSKRGSAKADTIAEVMQSPLINGLKADIARLEAKLVESSGNLGKNHPQTQRAESELATLKAQLESETRKITSSIETTYQVGKQREAQLQGALSSQKARVLALNKQRDELNVLRRDVESAQRAFEVVSQRASQTNLESQTTQTNIAVLNAATAPADPSKPKVFLNILVSIFLGTLLAVGLALMLELANRRVRSADDLADALNLPVLGSIAHTGAAA